jgi:hypothetical protein
VALAAGWWFARGLLVYGSGDPLGWHVFLDVGKEFERTVPFTAEITEFWRLQLKSFVGYFGLLTLAMPDWVYTATRVVLAAAAAGLGLTLLRARRLTPDSRWALAVLTVAAALAYASVLRLAISLDLVVAHARYLYVALAPASVLLVTGLARPLPAGARRWVCGGVVAVMASLAAWAVWFVIRPAYAPPRALSAVETARIQYPVDATFGDRLRLLGYDIEPAGDGRALTVRLYWEGLPGNWTTVERNGHPVLRPASAEDEVVFTHLVDARGEVVARLDERPFHGRYPTIAWRAGEVLSQEILLHIDPNAEAGDGAIRTGVYPEGRPDEALPVRSGTEELGGSLWIRPVQIGGDVR